MMTDEQYIDWLFQQEPCGYQNTPGFRAFLLDAMAVIGERPRAGDVASMHMAYTAGKEHGIARTWTDERPTARGEYWLSLQPSERRRGASKTAWPYQTKIEMGTSELVLKIPSDDGGWFFITLSDSTFLRNAKWSRRETPADPFEATG